MKKRVLLLITLVVSLFIYSGKVNGSQVMYMECDDNFSDFLAMITEGEGNVKFQIGYLKENDGGSGNDHFEFVLGDKDNCWIDDANKLYDKCSVGENGTEKLFNMNARLCPQRIRLAYEGTNDVVFAGQLGQSVYSNTLENNEYVFFEKDGKIYAESYYNANGIYSHINNLEFDDEYQKLIIYGANLKSNGHTNSDCISRSGLESICDFNREYWKVAQNHNFTYAYQECKNDDKCNFKTDYKVLFDSYNNRGFFNNKIEEWFDDTGTSTFNTNYNNFLLIVNDETFISAVDNMIESYENNGNYSFNDGYSAKEMYEKLKYSYENLKKIYDNPVKFKNYDVGSDAYLSDPVESALQYTMRETIGQVSIEKYCKSNKDYECLNISFLNNALYDDIKTYLNSKLNYSGDITILDLGNLNVLDNYTKKFLNAIAYFNKYSDSTDLSDNIKKNELPELKKNMAALAETRDIYTVIDCEDLISDKLKERINSYYNFFKILISLALIAFGLLDFGKAVFESDEKKMKEAQTKFIKRIIVVIILFLVPLFIKLILTIANAVWGNIYPGACGLF